MSQALKPFLVRLTPESVELLNKASNKFKKPKAVIINNAIKFYLESNDVADLNSRLNKVIG